jgi:hypothetical protein
VDVSAWLRPACCAAGLSMNRLAAELAMEPSTVHLWAAGKRLMPLYRLVGLRAVLAERGVTNPEDLPAPPPPPEPPAPPPSASAFRPRPMARGTWRGGMPSRLGACIDEFCGDPACARWRCGNPACGALWLGRRDDHAVLVGAAEARAAETVAA